jgi:hypothetical protein
MRTFALLAVVAACGHPDAVKPTPSAPIAEHPPVTIDTGAKGSRRMVPPEVFLQAYLTWFGGLVPLEVQKRAHGYNLFDQWTDYLAALGLPDYHLDVPRVTQSNPVMLATMGRLGEALCVRAVEHDLRSGAPVDQRVIFAFDAKPNPTLDDFARGFDVLHRTFLGYPADLAPSGRLGRFFALYQQVVAYHRDQAQPLLTPDQRAWAAVCTALVLHPETELY